MFILAIGILFKIMCENGVKYWEKITVAKHIFSFVRNVPKRTFKEYTVHFSPLIYFIRIPRMDELLANVKKHAITEEDPCMASHLFRIVLAIEEPRDEDKMISSSLFHKLNEILRGMTDVREQNLILTFVANDVPTIFTRYMKDFSKIGTSQLVQFGSAGLPLDSFFVWKENENSSVSLTMAPCSARYLENLVKYHEGLVALIFLSDEIEEFLDIYTSSLKKYVNDKAHSEAIKFSSFLTWLEGQKHVASHVQLEYISSMLNGFFSHFISCYVSLFVLSKKKVLKNDIHFGPAVSNRENMENEKLFNLVSIEVQDSGCCPFVEPKKMKIFSVDELMSLEPFVMIKKIINLYGPPFLEDISTEKSTVLSILENVSLKAVESNVFHSPFLEDRNVLSMKEKYEKLLEEYEHLDDSHKKLINESKLRTVNQNNQIEKLSSSIEELSMVIKELHETLEEKDGLLKNSDEEMARLEEKIALLQSTNQSLLGEYKQAMLEKDDLASSSSQMQDRNESLLGENSLLLENIDEKNDTIGRLSLQKNLLEQSIKESANICQSLEDRLAQCTSERGSIQSELFSTLNELSSLQENCRDLNIKVKQLFMIITIYILIYPFCPRMRISVKKRVCYLKASMNANGNWKKLRSSL